MYHVYYDHIRDLHKHRHTIPQGQLKSEISSPKNTTLGSHSLLILSDLLLNLGQRIRPAQFQVQVHVGTLEINTEGC